MKNIAKIGRIFGYLLVIAILVGGFTFVSRNEKLKSVAASFNAERDSYRSHHRPQDGWYYSVESISTEPISKKTFIIGRNMQPKFNTSKDGVLVSLEPNGRLYEVEVPMKTAGIKSIKAFFTVKTVDGKPTLIYFPSEQEVIKSMIQARDISSGT